jgi:hypothetical protein
VTEEQPDGEEATNEVGCAGAAATVTDLFPPIPVVGVQVLPGSRALTDKVVVLAVSGPDVNVIGPPVPNTEAPVGTPLLVTT